MIGFAKWRELFYQLAEQYPDCLMLKFTMKLISDAGYQSEITSASTASHQPEVFSGLVRNALLQVAAAKPTEVEEQLKDFNVCVRVCVIHMCVRVRVCAWGAKKLLNFL